MNAEAGQGTSLRPCPFCGHLESAAAERCRRCRLALDQKALHGLKRLMGVWHLLDERSPTGPGVNWQKFRQLIESDHVYEDSIIRGPATHGVWQYAKDTPSVATLLGLCWSCHYRLSDGKATHCPRCEVELNAPLDWPPTEENKGGVEEPIPAPPAEDDLLASGTREREFRDVSFGMTWKDLLLRVLGFLAVGAACAAVFWYAFLFAWHGRLVGPDEHVAASARNALVRSASADKYAAPSTMPQEQSEGEMDTSPPQVAALTPPPAPAATSSPVTPPAAAHPPAPVRAIVSSRAAQPPSPGIMPVPGEPQAAPTPAQPEVAAVRPPVMPPSPSIMPVPRQEPDKAPSPVAPAGGEAAKSPPAPATMPASRPAESDQPEPEGAREAYSAKIIFAIARQAQADGDLVKAEVLLRQMMTTHDKTVWPDGAEEMLQATQKLIRGSPRPKEPAQPELTKMWQEAKELSDDALALEKQNNLPQAFNKLATVIYRYPSTVWPKSTFECFRRVIHNMRKQDLPPLP